MIIHILKDGTVLDDISGHVVKREDVPEVYILIEQLQKKRRNKNED